MHCTFVIVASLPDLLRGCRRLAVLAVAASLSWSGMAAAQVFKCADERNQPVYQDHPCPPGKELRDFSRDPAEVSVIESPPASGAPTRGKATPAPRPRAGGTQKPAKASAGNPAERRFIHVGMQQGEVVARIGAPDMKDGAGSRKRVRWSYMPTPGDPQTLTTIVLESGRVVDVERKLLR